MTERWGYRWSTLWAGAVSFAALSACSASHDVSVASDEILGQSNVAGAGAAAIVPATNLCERLSMLQCAAEQRCCSSPGRGSDECRSALRVNCEQTVFLDAIAANRVSGYDAATAERVLGELEQKFDSCDADAARWSAEQAGLRSMFQGTIAPGKSCTPAQVLSAETSVQAAALLSCRDARTTACLPESVLGAWTCTAKSSSGGSCVTDDNCQADAYCSLPAQSLFGSCQERLEEGAACSGDSACRSFACREGACVPADQQTTYCPS